MRLLNNGRKRVEISIGYHRRNSIVGEKRARESVFKFCLKWDSKLGWSNHKSIRLILQIFSHHVSRLHFFVQLIHKLFDHVYSRFTLITIYLSCMNFIYTLEGVELTLRRGNYTVSQSAIKQKEETHTWDLEIQISRFEETWTKSNRRGNIGVPHNMNLKTFVLQKIVIRISPRVRIFEPIGWFYRCLTRREIESSRKREWPLGKFQNRRIWGYLMQRPCL